MKRLLTATLFLLIYSIGYGQIDLSGKIVDKSDNKPLTNASIILLNQDSIMQNFVRADEDGKFTFKKIESSPYILIVSYPKFELYSKTIDPENKNLDIGTISLSSQANLIEEVIVSQKLPIKIKGDTIEYDAGSFETEKNAKLEDLLRRLPGLTVAADGAITAHGKSVSKVLIDGEEFFGYDPKIAIRNVRADAVDKVQVYERKSEEAELTGIDDGVRIQTVNVVLKEEARKGIFGNAEALVGTSDLYTGNLFVAKFNKTERIGITANSNNMGANSGGREGSIRSNSQITGDPKNTSVGANYENQFFNRKLNVNGNYNYNIGSNRNESSSYNKQIVPEIGVQETDHTSKNENSNQGHSFNSRFRLRVDSTSNMDIQFNANLSDNENSSASTSNVRNEDMTKVSDYSSNSSSFGNSSSNDIRINYRKRLNNNGRSINLHFNNRYNENESENLVNQNTYFYKNDSTTVINQNRVSNTSGNNISAQFQFGDRITEQINYSLGYNISNSSNKNLTNALDLNNASIIDSTYSQNQKTLNTNQALVGNLSYNTEKINFNLSNRTSHRNQSLEDSYRLIDLDRNFWDNDLNISLNYRISNRKNINVSYQNNYDIPSFGQLQPLQPQTNPLFIQEGNPDLKRSTNNSFRVNFNTFSLLKGTSWNVNGNIGIKSNPIINIRTIDTNSVTTSSYININGKSSWNASINSNFNKPIFDKKVQFNVFSGLNYNNGFSYVRYGNDVQNSDYELNNSQNTNLFAGTGINEQDSKGFDYDLSWRFSINNQRNSLNKTLNYTNLNTGASGLFKYFLPKSFNIATMINYSLEGPTKFYDKSIHQFYTNIELSKKLLKNQSLTASIKAFDIFNTYNRVNRNVSDTNFSESTQLMMTQYVLFGLKWDFNKNLGKKSED